MNKTLVRDRGAWIDELIADALTARNGAGRAGRSSMTVEREDVSAGVASSSLGGPTPHETRHAAPFKRWVRWAVTGDLIAAALAALLAAVLRFGWDTEQPVSIPYHLLGLLIALSWPIVAASAGAYELRTMLFGVEELRRVLRTGVILLAALGMAHFVFRLNLSRGYVGALVPTVVVLTAGYRIFLRTRLSKWVDRGDGRHCVVAVGPADEIVHLVADLETRDQVPIEVIAFVADDLDADQPVPDGLAHLRRLDSRDEIRVLAENGISFDMLVRAGQPQSDELWTLGRRAYELGIPVAVAPRRQDAAGNVAVSYVPLGSTPLLVVETPTLKPIARIAKAIFDRVFAALALIVLLPVIALIALVIAVRDGRPVLFRQERVGHRGERFQLVKFRTMRPDAEAHLEQLLELNEAAGPLFKMKDDPRVTRTGRFLRRYSLDELPQIVQVLTGTMSIVGPRPPLPCEVATYDERTARRLLVKPGLTGLWQVEGRSDLPWDDGVYLDLMYIDHWSPLLDLVIIARTIKTIIRPTGAY
jgi:exopolysaccharide biosynthesis polyprenyl glycosylphosphotransferase